MFAIYLFSLLSINLPVNDHLFQITQNMYSQVISFHSEVPLLTNLFHYAVLLNIISLYLSFSLYSYMISIPITYLINYHSFSVTIISPFRISIFYLILHFDCFHFDLSLCSDLAQFYSTRFYNG